MISDFHQVATSARDTEREIPSRFQPVVLPIEHTRHPSEDAWLPIVSSLPEVGTGRLLYVAVVKRALDIVASLALIVVLSPLVLIAVALIRLDSPGPAVFSQKRIGRGGQPFRLFKFRTMAHNPTDSLEWLEDEHGELRHKLRDDPRITRFGRWLRRSSMDELPQLINVVRGDMSLIGPRPELPEIVARYEPWQHERHLVRPGLTGWWQVSGRGDLPMHENTELDIFYVRRQSFRLDLLIARKTVRVVMRGLGAF